MDYTDFLKEKVRFTHATGVEIDPTAVNPLLKPHQRDIVLWAVRGGCRAIFAAFGLGKSMIQLEIMRLLWVSGCANHRLLVAPLGVRQEFKRDAYVLNTGDSPYVTDEERETLRRWQAEQSDFPEKRQYHVQFIRSDAEIGEPGLYLTNYESVRDGKLDPNNFDAASLDEADVLRSFGSKTYQTFLTLFEAVRYRFVATATPSPNRFKELIHYAGFLGIMDTGQALTRFFQRDSSKANNLTLYPHKELEFWLWLSTWAVFVQRPSDLGYSDEGYDLPPLDVRYHEVPVDHAGAGHDKQGQNLLFRDAALSLQDTAREKRDTLPVRIEKMREILDADPDAHYLLWHDLEAERHAITRAVPEAVPVYGSQDLEEREQRVIDFGDGRHQYLAAKPVIAGSGCNFQRHCHKAIFLGIGYKFRDFIQAIHRIHRFQQGHPCEIHIIYAESEREVLRELLRKWKEHELMVAKMTEIIRKYGLAQVAMPDVLTRSIGVERLEVLGERFHAVNNDCVDETRQMETNSVDQIVTSIPFSNHYEYTPSYNDFGHTDDDDHFLAQMDYLTPELLRVLKPGRVACIHVKDRILFGNVTGKGMPTVNPFHAKCIAHYIRHGFAYMGMITVVTDVVRENNQTYRLGWSEQCKDGTKMGVGSPEYVLLLRKLPTDTDNAYADEPVTKSKDEYSRSRWQVDAHAFWRSSGNRLLTAEEMASYPPDTLSRIFTQHTLENVYDYEHHVRVGEGLDHRGALPATFMTLAPGSHHPDVWHDVNRMRTLNGEQTRRGLQNHVCPLQFDIVDRLITRYSNEGDEIYDPFAGLMTVPYRALHLGRRGRGTELNTDYFMDGVKYLEAKERELDMPDLFEFDKTDAESEEGAA